MARKLRGFPGTEPGAAMPGGEAPTAVQEKPGKKWLPFTGSQDLPRPQTVEKVVVRTLGDGTTFTQKVTKFIKPGEPRFSVDENGTVIAHYLKRGGVGRKFVRQYKRKYLDTPEGRKRRNSDAQHRSMLRANGIPGA